VQPHPAAPRGSVPLAPPGPSLLPPGRSPASGLWAGQRLQRGVGRRRGRAGRGGGLPSGGQEKANPPTDRRGFRASASLRRPCGASCLPWLPLCLPSVWVWGRPAPRCWVWRRQRPPRSRAQPRPRVTALHSRPRRGMVSFQSGKSVGPLPFPAHTHTPTHTHTHTPCAVAADSAAPFQPALVSTPRTGASGMLAPPALNLPFLQMRKLWPGGGEKRGAEAPDEKEQSQLV
jgi:hypothetical protein